MKKIICFVLIFVVTLFSLCIIGFGATRETAKNIKIDPLSISDKSINFQLTNTSDKDINYTFNMTLEKKVKNMWKKVPFKKDAKFNKTLYTLEGNDSNTTKIIWKDYFDSNLSKGIYRFTFIEDTLVFYINKRPVNVLEMTSPRMCDIEN